MPFRYRSVGAFWKKGATSLGSPAKKPWKIMHSFHFRKRLPQIIATSRISENSVKPRPNKAPTLAYSTRFSAAVNDATIINHCIEFLQRYKIWRSATKFFRHI